MTKTDEYIEKTLEETTDSDLQKLKALRKKKKENSDFLNENIRKVLLYSGFIGAGISAISYLIATFVMINGVSASLSIQNQVLFSVLGAAVGILISSLLRMQGINYAKQNPEVKDIMANYVTEVNKSQPESKAHLIGWYMFWALVKDVFLKGLSVAISTFLVVYIFVKGSGDWSLLWLAISNIGLFTGFGLVSLSKMYENYIEKHLPAVISRTAKLRAKALEEERLLQLEKERIEKELKAKEKAKAKKATTKKKYTAKKKPTNKKKPKVVKEKEKQNKY